MGPEKVLRFGVNLRVMATRGDFTLHRAAEQEPHYAIQIKVKLGTPRW